MDNVSGRHDGEIAIVTDGRDGDLLFSPRVLGAGRARVRKTDLKFMRARRIRLTKRGRALYNSKDYEYALSGAVATGDNDR